MTIEELPESFVTTLNTVSTQLLNNVVSPIDIELLILLIHNSNCFNHSYVLSLIAILDHLIQSPNYYDIDPEMYVIKLYEAVLCQVPLYQILDMYPMDLIIENIKYGNQFTLLIIKILTINANADILMNEPLLLEVLKLYLTNNDLLIAISNQIQILFLQLSDTKLNILNNQPFQRLFHDTKISNNSTLISRLLDLITLLYPVVNFDISFGFDSDDILLNLLIINYYEKLIQKQDPMILQKITPDVEKVFALYKMRMSDPDIELILATDIVILIATLSYKFPDFPISILNFNDLSLENASDIKLFSRVNPAVLSKDVLKELSDYPLFNSKYILILFSLVNKECTFNYLCTKGVITHDKIKNLTTDNLFELLIVLTGTDYGVSYLLNELPSVVNDHLISDNIINSDIYYKKLQVMENLVLKNHNLYIWQDQLIEAYKVMKNGKNIRHEARVAIADETV